MSTQLSLINELSPDLAESGRWPRPTAGTAAADGRQMLEHMGRLFDVTHDLLAVVGIEDDRIRFLNASWERVLGYTREEMMNNSLAAYLHPDDLVETLRDVEKVGAGEPTNGFVNRLRCKDETYRWLSWSSVASAEQGCIYMAARDITDQKRTEERTQRLAQALDDNNQMIAMSAEDGRAVFVNRAFLQKTGYREEELLGISFAETVISPNNPPEVRKEFWATLASAGNWSGDYLLRRKDGSDFPVGMSVSVLRDSEGRPTGTLGISQDITERKRTEERVRKLAQALENNTEMISVGDQEGRAEFVNKALLRASGFEEAELLGKRFNDTLLSPNNPPNLAKEIEEHISAEGRWSGECLQRRKNGEDLPVALSVGLIRDDDGRVTGGFGMSQDITAKRKLEEQLRRAHKMEAVGQLAGGVAHDFNNLLMVIIGYAGELAEQLEAGSPLRREADEIRKAGERAGALTRQLLAFSRRQVLEPKVLNLNSLVDDLKKMLGRVISEDIELVTALDAELGEVEADQGQLEQVIVNLAVNARDAMPAGGKLTIETADEMIDETFVRQHPPMTAGEYARLSVIDTGIGMDAVTVSRIFEPFFTTKEPGKGTGLGLATVYGVVKQSGGFIWVSSEPGKGARFDVYLPRVHARATEKISTPSWDGERKGSEKILLVEDDEALRNLVLESLRQWGYEVFEAANGNDAMGIARERSGDIDLLLTDVVMPGMNGPQVAEKVVGLNPEIKVLFMSGYSDLGNQQRSFFGRDRRLLQKPYKLPELARAIREVLETNPEVELSPRR
jgi:two-component system cell cycle sensor histidine kinase/response regulator CckA